jgi:bacteriorhodopsin
METEPHKTDREFVQEKSPSPLTVTYKRRRVKMRSVFEHELESVHSASLQSGLFWGLTGMALSAFTSFYVALTSGGITDSNIRRTYVDITVITAFATLVFVGLAILAQIKLRRALKLIRQGEATDAEMIWSEETRSWVEMPPDAL